MLALPIFPCSHPQSIFGADELNFCVRDGNRWTLAAINTNYISVIDFRREHFVLYRIPLSLSRRSLVTRTGFEPMLTA